jgi:hypothetical protein
METNAQIVDGAGRYVSYFFAGLRLREEKSSEAGRTNT